MTAPHIIYTIGHGSDSFDAFLERLAPHRVTTVVDVRSHPVSRHAPDFDKPTLVEEAASAGLGYRWLGAELGGRPRDPGLYDGRGEDGRGENAGGEVRWQELARSAAFSGGIEQLIGLARSSTIAVMCSELEPRQCHRSHAIAPALEMAGFEVIDILADGSAAPHQPRLM